MCPIRTMTTTTSGMTTPIKRITKVRVRPISITRQKGFERKTATALLWGDRGRAVTVYVTTTALGGWGARRDGLRQHGGPCSRKLDRPAPLSH